MAAMRYLVPALAVAGRAAAQCSAATTTLQNAADASALASCQTFTGSIAIATGTTDNIAIDGVQRIQGSLTAINATQMGELSGSSLAIIDDSFTLQELTILSSLNFPRLAQVGTIDWEALPQLQGLSFTTGVQQASQVLITNTQLNTLDGIDLNTVDVMTITENNYLNNVNMQLGNVTNSLTLAANGRNVSATFPNMEWAYNMTFRNCSTVTIPSLATLNGSMGFYSNFFSEVYAPNLTTVGGTLAFVSNPDVTNISFPELKTVNGALQIANNTDLQSINGFPSLQTISGALAFEGDFTNVTLPALQNVKGAFNLSSTGNISSSCATFQPLSGSNNVIKGTYSCTGAQGSSGSGSSGSGSSGSGSSGSGSGSKKSSAATLYVSGSLGLLGVIAAIFGML